MIYISPFSIDLFKKLISLFTSGLHPSILFAEYYHSAPEPYTKWYSLDYQYKILCLLKYRLLFCLMEWRYIADSVFLAALKVEIVYF